MNSTESTTREVGPADILANLSAVATRLEVLVVVEALVHPMREVVDALALDVVVDVAVIAGKAERVRVEVHDDGPGTLSGIT